MKRHKLAVVLIPVVVLAVIFIAINGLAATPGAAKDAKGCEGLGDYREEMFALWSDGPEAWVGDRDESTLSSDEWLELSGIALEFQRGLKKIDPPEFAAAWHQVAIEHTGLTEQMARAIADGGLLVGLGFKDSYDASEAKREAAVETGAAMCADFDDFVRDYRALPVEDGGTPAAESPASTAGTPRAG